MKKLFPGLVLLAFAVGLSPVAQAENSQPQKEPILSALGAAALMEKGSSDAEIVQLLAKQRGLDRTAAPLKGKTDKQALYYLVAVAEPQGKVVDLGKDVTHKAAGDAALKAKLYEKAATEYSLAINYSVDKYDIYKLRGDSYKEYLKEQLPLSSPDNQDEEKRPLFKRKRDLICNSIIADYRTAARLVDKSIQDGITKMEELEVTMLELRKGSDETLKFKKRSSSHINIMRDMRRLLYRQSSAKSAAKHLGLAVDEYKTVCAEEEVERRNLIQQTRDKTRDKKWLWYAEKDDVSYFYDKTSLAKAKNGTTVVTRRENSDDEVSFALDKVTLDCKKKTIGTRESSVYDEDGKLSSKAQFTQILFKNIVTGTANDLLSGKICK